MDTSSVCTGIAGTHDTIAVPVPPTVSPSLGALLRPSLIDNVAHVTDQLARARLGTVSGVFRALYLKHPPTAKHSLRVALGCSAFATYLQLDAELLERVEIAALLHDVGKIGVADHILNKPSRLDADEFAAMEHSRNFGVHILEAFCADNQLLEILRCASYWFDGTRPANTKAKGEAIPLGSRLMAIQDAYDSMTTDQVFRPAMTPKHAIAELVDRSPTQFDPNLVASFADMITSDSGALQSDIVRRWVETMGERSDGLWGFQASLSQVQIDTPWIFQQRLLDMMSDGVVFADLSGRLLLWNRGAERLTGLSSESLHHKMWHPQIVDLRDLNGNSIKQRSCPLLNCLRSFAVGMHRMTITNRKSGIRIAVNVHVIPVRDADGAYHGACMMMHDVSPEQTLEERVQDLHQEATRDALTGVNNRAEFDRFHQRLVLSHGASGEPFSLIICDIDRFKSINDTYGHPAGDEALIEFAQLIQRHSRENDLVARYGGEEFVMLCPGCCLADAVRKAEEIRRELARTPQRALRNETMTASFGVTELQSGDNAETMLKRADRALYDAKESGRNRVAQLGDKPCDTNAETKRSSWFTWGRVASDVLLKRTLISNVPVDLVKEKVRGFIADHDAGIEKFSKDVVELFFDDRNLPAQRRQNDRPTPLTLSLRLEEEIDGANTRVHVEIAARQARERRRDDSTFRADQLLVSLKSYLMAEDA